MLFDEIFLGCLETAELAIIRILIAVIQEMTVHVIFNDSILAALDAISALHHMLLILIIVKLVIASHRFQPAVQLDGLKQSK